MNRANLLRIGLFALVGCQRRTEPSASVSPSAVVDSEGPTPTAPPSDAVDATLFLNRTLDTERDDGSSTGSMPRWPSVRSLRDIDWKNIDYRYNSDEWVRVTNGAWERRVDDLPAEFLVIREVVLGDLTGDGLDEAVIYLNENAGSAMSSGTMEYADVIMLVGERPIVVQRLDAGSCSRSVIGVRISEARLLMCLTGTRYLSSYPECNSPVLQTWRWDPTAMHMEMEAEAPRGPDQDLDRVRRRCFPRRSSVGH